jgi:hypothetical protein
MERAVAGQFEAKADSTEMHRYPPRRRSLPALRPSFYTRWFCCMNNTCKTKLVMPARFKVV